MPPPGGTGISFSGVSPSGTVGFPGFVISDGLLVLGLDVSFVHFKFPL